jgi:hypothetical protein
VTTAAPQILTPLAISDVMLTSSTVAEPSATETAWVSGASYAVGDKRIRVATHREYMALTTHTGIATPPEGDPTRWRDIGPTDRWAMFDTACDTRTTATTNVTVVVKPGFFSAIAAYKLIGATLDITVKDAPGGAVVASQSFPLHGPYLDEYDWCWGPPRQRNKALMTGILPYPDAEVTLTVSGPASTEVGIGMVVFGTQRSLVLGEWGGTEYGATAEPVDYSYIKTDEFGNTVIKRRANATDMRLRIMLPQADADYALACLQDALGTPAAVIATTAAGYSGLNVFGLITGPVRYAGPGYAIIEAYVKGLI